MPLWVDLLSKNLRRPSKVCARPEIDVPMAERKVWKTPRMAFKRPWKTATMEPKTAVMAPKMEEIRDSRELMSEGMMIAFLLGS